MVGGGFTLDFGFISDLEFISLLNTRLELLFEYTELLLETFLFSLLLRRGVLTDSRSS